MRDQGNASFDQGNISQAIELYSRALEFDSEDHQSLANLSSAYLREGSASSTLKALSCAKRIVGINAACRRSYYNKGQALCLLQQFEEAFAVFRDGVRIYPEDEALQFALSDCDTDSTTANTSASEMKDDEVNDQVNSHDESLDVLAKFVQQAAAKMNLPFTPSSCGADIFNRDLHLEDPLNPSGLTLDTYFRRDDRSLPSDVASLSKSNPNCKDECTFNIARSRLKAVMECLDKQPVHLPSAYIDEVKTETLLGEGFYGDVRLGVDIELGQQFAIKIINPLIIEQALAIRLENIQKSFQNEVKVSYIYSMFPVLFHGFR